MGRHVCGRTSPDDTIRLEDTFISPSVIRHVYRILVRPRIEENDQVLVQFFFVEAFARLPVVEAGADPIGANGTVGSRTINVGNERDVAVRLHRRRNDPVEPFRRRLGSGSGEDLVRGPMPVEIVG